MEQARGNGARPHITVRDLTMAYGDFVVMRDLSFTVYRGDVFIIMGGSGSGKSTLLRHMIGLEEPARGEIFYGEESFPKADPERRLAVLRRVGVLFQNGALSRSMTLEGNAGRPLGGNTDLSPGEFPEVAGLKLPPAWPN